MTALPDDPSSRGGDDLVAVLAAAFGYRGRPVVAGASCRIVRGRCLGVYGPNGAGKSTLLRGVTGLLAPVAGSVAVAPGTRFGYLPQQRAAEAHWPMSALDAASLATSARRRLGFVGPAARARVRERMAELGVADLARGPFFQLSGGQQQRVMLAGALADEPDALLLDEPTGELDVRSRDLLLGHLAAAKAGGLALVLVSHEPADLLALADDAVLLEPGEQADAPSTARSVVPAELFEQLVARPPIGQGTTASAAETSATTSAAETGQVI